MSTAILSKVSGDLAQDGSYYKPWSWTLWNFVQYVGISLSSVLFCSFRHRSSLYSGPICAEAFRKQAQCAGPGGKEFG